jgi:hypothetical protein
MQNQIKCVLLVRGRKSTTREQEVGRAPEPEEDEKKKEKKEHRTNKMYNNSAEMLTPILRLGH